MLLSLTAAGLKPIIPPPCMAGADEDDEDDALAPEEPPEDVLAAMAGELLSTVTVFFSLAPF